MKRSRAIELAAEMLASCEMSDKCPVCERTMFDLMGPDGYAGSVCRCCEAVQLRDVLDLAAAANQERDALAAAMGEIKDLWYDEDRAASDISGDIDAMMANLDPSAALARYRGKVLTEAADWFDAQQGRVPEISGASGLLRRMAGEAGK